MIQLAAIAATTILTGLAIFQLALIFGKPLGKFAWGGQHTILPMKLRVASSFSILLYVLFSFLILHQANAISFTLRSGWFYYVLLIVTIYFFIGIVMNAISRSHAEKITMTPVATILALLFLYVLMNVK